MTAFVEIAFSLGLKLSSKDATTAAWGARLAVLVRIYSRVADNWEESPMIFGIFKFDNLYPRAGYGDLLLV